MLFFRLLLSVFFVSLSAFAASANCLEAEKSELFRELKNDFLSGNYDAFFDKSDSGGAIPKDALQGTKVQLIQYIGVPRTCIDMARKSYSDNFKTLLTAFVGSQGQIVYIFFSMLAIDGVEEIVWVQLSTDYSEIHQYLR